jgi:hypothetical protein
VKHEETTPLVTCPNCGSTDISEPYFSRRLFACGLLLLGFPFIWLNRERWCFGCSRAVKGGGG